MTSLENNHPKHLQDKSSAPGGSTAERAADQMAEIPSAKEKNKAESLARFIGGSEPVLWMKKYIEKVAPLESNVLITGPSGSGKELVADISIPSATGP